MSNLNVADANEKLLRGIAKDPREIALTLTGPRSLEEHYNQLADQALLQHTTLADSRSSMLQMFNRLDSTLSSLSKLQANASALLSTLTQESIPELTDESTKQLVKFQTTMADIETKRIMGLQTRVSTARESTTKLGNRMADVRSRLRAWEEKEIEDDRRRRRRVGFIWGTMAVMLALTVLLLIWGRMNEHLEAREFLAKNWTEIVIEKEANRSDVDGSDMALAELLRSLQEDDFDRTEQSMDKLPGEDSGTEQDDGLLSSVFDEL